MGWYYLKKAEEEPRTGGPLMREALAHSESALYQKPGWVQATRLHSRALNIDTLPVPAVPEAPPPVIELPIPNACGTINTAMSSDIPDCN